MGLLESKKNSGNLLSWHDGRSGTLFDFSGNGRHGTITGDVKITQKGFVFNGASGYINTNSDYISTSPCTIITSIIPRSTGEGTVGRIISNQGVVLSMYPGDRCYVSSNNASTLLIAGLNTVKLQEKNIIATTRSSDGLTGNIYINGIFQVTGSTGTPAGGITNVIIGNQTGENVTFNGTISWVLVFNQVLTGNEINTISAEMENMKYPSKTNIKNKSLYPYPSDLLDANMESTDTANWSAVDATLSKVSSTLVGGTQALRITSTAATFYAGQTVLSIGKKYRIRGFCRSDGTALIRITDSAATTIYSSAATSNWVYFDTTWIAGVQTLYIGSNSASGWVEFDNIQLTCIDTDSSIDLWRSGYGSKITSDISSGFIDDTGFVRYTGTWKVSTSTIKGAMVKVIECVSTGIAYIPISELGQSPTKSAYGTWEFWVYKSDTLNSIYVMLTALLNSSYVGSSQTGYGYSYYNNEQHFLYKQVAGANTNLCISSVDSSLLSTWFKVKITRTTSGVFTIYINDVLLSVSSGTNPITDNTNTTSKYILIAGGNGDKFALSDVSGNIAFKKSINVI